MNYIAAFLLLFAIGAAITPETTNRIVFYLIYVLPKIGVFCLWFALVASLWSATQYTFTFAEKLKKIVNLKAHNLIIGSFSVVGICPRTEKNLF